MNKKLIAAAIAAVVAAPAAVAADTTLYGKLHIAIQSNDLGANDNYTVNNRTSRIGIKGSEDLGDGLKAIFKLEMAYNMTDNGGGNPFGGRNSYIGLSGGWGTFLAGRHDTPAKVAWYAAGNDVIGDSIVDFNRIGFTERRLDNAIAYISPNMSGFTVAAAVVPGEGTTGTNNDINNAYSLGAIYAGGGLKAGIGYEVADKEYLGGTASDEKMLQVSASYTFGDFMIGGSYQDVSDKAGTSGRDQTVWGLVAKASFGNNYVMANYGDNDDNGITTDGTTWGLGVGHKFSKRTQVYAAYDNRDNGTAADTSAFALGMIHTF